MKRILVFVFVAILLGGCVTVKEVKKGENLKDFQDLIANPVVNPVPKAR